MAQVTTVPVRNTKFSNGEISPSMFGDVSHPKYMASLRTCKNWLPIPQGALVNRPGLKYVAPTKAQTYAPRLVPFVFSDSFSFFLEFGDDYIRVYRNGAQVVLAGAAPAWDATVLYKQGFVVSYVGSYWVARAQSIGAQPNISPAAWSGPYAAGAPYEITTNPITGGGPYLKRAQVGDTITICYGGQVAGTPAIPPQDLSHTGSANYPWLVTPTPLKIPTGAVTWAAGPADGVGGWSSLATYAKGDRAYNLDAALPPNLVEWISIQDTNLNHKPPDPATLNSTGTSINGNLFWMPAVDLNHPAVKTVWRQTAVVQDASGVTYESDPSPVRKIDSSLGLDRQRAVVAATPTLAAGYTLLYYRFYRGTAGGLLGWVADVRVADLVNYPSDPANSCFLDDGRAPDFAQQPPAGTNPFSVGAGFSYPSVVGYFDQRRLFASSLLIPQGLFLSKDGDFYNYDRPSPGADTDALLITVASEKLEQVRSFAPMRRGVVLTGQGEWALSGLGGGPISKTSRDLKWQSGWGSNWLDPIKIGTGLLFNTAKSNMVRDFYPLYGLYSDIWDGQELSFMARHMFDLFTITDWAFQSTPYPVVWAVRSDGKLLSLTYQHAPPSFGQQLAEGVCAWAVHETGGAQSDAFEAVCVVPEPPEDAVYVVVRRTVQGVTRRYIERMANPVCPALPTSVIPAGVFANPPVPGATDPRYGVYLDSAVQYDGHNLNGGSGFCIDSVVVPGSLNPADYLTDALVQIAPGGAVSPYAGFTVGDVGKIVVVFDPENLFGLGSFSVKVTGFVSATTVRGELQSDLTQVQVNKWALASGNSYSAWGIARSTIALANLTGYPVDTLDANLARGINALGDGNPAAIVDFSGGVVTLLSPALVICAGVSYNCDAALLDAHHPNADIRNRFKKLVRIGFEVGGARGLWAGADFDELWQWQQRKVADSYANVPLAVGYFEQEVTDSWDKGGRACFRQIDPLPMTLTSALREYELGGT